MDDRTKETLNTVSLGTASAVGTLVNAISSFFGININSMVLRDAINKNSAMRKLVDDAVSEYERKIATTTASSRPSADKFYMNYFTKQRERLIPLKRELDLQAERAERKSNNTVLDMKDTGTLMADMDSTNQKASQMLDTEKHMAKLNTLVRGQSNKFTNAKNLQTAIRKEGHETVQNKLFQSQIK